MASSNKYDREAKPDKPQPISSENVEGVLENVFLVPLDIRTQTYSIFVPENVVAETTEK